MQNQKAAADPPPPFPKGVEASLSPKQCCFVVFLEVRLQLMCLIKPDLYFELGFTLETCIYSTTLNAGGREGILRLAVNQDRGEKGYV